MIAEELKEGNWVNVRMRALLADAFCPRCGAHNKLHDNDACGMRYIPEETYEQI